MIKENRGGKTKTELKNKIYQLRNQGLLWNEIKTLCNLGSRQIAYYHYLTCEQNKTASKENVNITEEKVAEQTT